MIYIRNESLRLLIMAVVQLALILCVLWSARHVLVESRATPRI